MFSHLGAGRLPVHGAVQQHIRRWVVLEQVTLRTKPWRSAPLELWRNRRQARRYFYTVRAEMSVCWTWRVVAVCEGQQSWHL